MPTFQSLSIPADPLTETATLTFAYLGQPGIPFPLDIDMKPVAGAEKNLPFFPADDIPYDNVGTLFYMLAAFFKIALFHKAPPFQEQLLRWSFGNANTCAS